mmetsp:Transcript_18581/g.44524  ORF Transcript_18581/g.44524 Transcript_18581/m.44524 type:complete len:233 (-) Transcript_18581:112-810(-)
MNRKLRENRRCTGAEQRAHNFAAVRRDDALQERHRSRNFLFAQECNNADLRQAAVVELSKQTCGFRLLGHTLRPLEGIVEVESNPVRQQVWLGVEIGEVARLAALHVVRGAVHTNLRPPLQKADGEENLELSSVRQSIPLFRRAHGSRGCGVEARVRRPREVNTVGLQHIAHEGSHRDATVLDLRMAKEANRLFVRVVPELRLCQLERVPESDDRVETGREALEVADRLHLH